MATLRRILKVFLWTVMAAVLTVVAVVMCMVNLISEESKKYYSSKFDKVMEILDGSGLE